MAQKAFRTCTHASYLAHECTQEMTALGDTLLDEIRNNTGSTRPALDLLTDAAWLS